MSGIEDLDEFDIALARHLIDKVYGGWLNTIPVADEDMTAWVVAGIKAYRAWQAAPIETRMPHPRHAVTTAIEYAIPGRPLYDETAEAIGDYIRGVDAQMRSTS